MNMHYTIDTSTGITIIEFSQAPTLEDAKAVINTLAEENAYHVRLWDFSNVTFNFTMDEIKEIAKYGQTKFLEKNRLALVVSQDLAFGLLRAFEVYRQQEMFSIPRVFRNKQEAMVWLGKEKKILKEK